MARPGSERTWWKRNGSQNVEGWSGFAPSSRRTRFLTRGIEREVLPVAQQYAMGVLVWGPLGQGMLTGRVRRGQATNASRAKFPTAFSDERRLDAVEQLIPR